MVDVRPDPKPGSRSEGRTRPRRTFRKAATRDEWAEIIRQKAGPCRVCATLTTVRGDPINIEYHHLVPRSAGGDDVADNIVPLCVVDHGLVTRRSATELRLLAASLDDSEYAYCVSKLGEGAIERLFGVGAAR